MQGDSGSSASLRWVGLALLLVTFAAYAQVLTYSFLNYDDNLYVTENRQVQQGLTLENVRWAFTNTHSSNWSPLTWLSHMLDCRLFGLNPKGHHLSSLLFHLANTWLLLLVLTRMTGQLWPSTLVAALFALHPLHVESVAWVAERKDVLSTFFWLLTMIAYVNFVRHRGRARYAAVAILFALGLMAKPMLVTLPFVLLLLDYWPLGRLSDKGAKIRSRWHFAARLVREKIPLFLLVGVFSAVTYVAQRSGEAVVPFDKLPLGPRVSNALTSYANYITKMLWPDDLAPFYPHARRIVPAWALGGALLVLIVTYLVIREARRRPYLPVGWFWYLGTLVPVIGLVQVGEQARADRYTYVPLIGLFIMLAWGIVDLSARWSHRKTVLGVSAAIVIFLLTVCTWVQAGYWRDSITLFEHAVRVVPNNYLALNNLGAAYADAGRYEKTIEVCSRAVEIMPNYANAYYLLGKGHDVLGRNEEAIKNYKQAISYDRDFVLAHKDLAMVYGKAGRFDEAADAWKGLLRLQPDNGKAHYNLGRAWAVLGRREDAAQAYQEAIRCDPSDALAYDELGKVYGEMGRFEEAIAAWKEVIRVQPNHARLHYNLGRAYQALGRREEAITAYQEAIQREPAYAMAHNNLAMVYAQAGKYAEAIAAWKEAIRIKPDLAQAHYNLGLLYVLRRRPDLALQEYEALKTLNPDLANRLLDEVHR